MIENAVAWNEFVTTHFAPAIHCKNSAGPTLLRFVE